MSCSTRNTLTGDGRSAGALLAAGVQELGHALEPARQRQLLDLAELLARWAPRMNLTAHRSAEAIVRRLILDALALERLLPAAQRIADLGSGAGFPGLPLAVIRPDARILLVEARERRHHFQRAAIRALGLTNAEPLRGRIEALAPRACDGVVAQALAQPSEAVRLARRWCELGGWIAIPGADDPPEPGPVDGVEARPLARYRVPLSGPERTLWLGSAC